TVKWAVLAVGFVAFIWWWKPQIDGQPLLAWTPRGDSLDSVKGRLSGMTLAALRLTWRGRGRGSMARDLRRWTTRGGKYLPLDALFCEPLQVLYEYGLRGGLILVVCVASFFAVIPLQSPWGEAGVGFAVLSLGHVPARVAG